MNPDQWFVLGSILSDGHIGKYHIVFTQSEDHIFYLKKIRMLLNRIEFVNVEVNPRTKAKKTLIKGKLSNCQATFGITLYGKSLTDKWKSIKKEFLSNSLYPQSKEEKVAFIEGYWYGDGSLSISSNKNQSGFKPCVAFHESDSALLEIVKKIMADLGFGYPQQITRPNNDDKYHILKYTGITEDFIRLVRPMMKVRIERLIEYLKFHNAYDSFFQEYVKEYLANGGASISTKSHS